jgi:hypothetical protein
MSCKYPCTCRQCEKFDPLWPHGHVTTDGKEAKYLGPAMVLPGWSGFLIDNKVILVDQTGRYNHSAPVITVVNKPAPKKWYNTYRSGPYSSADKAKCLSKIDMNPQNRDQLEYRGTFEYSVD